MQDYKEKVFLVLLLVILQLFGTVPVFAEPIPARQEIRVGLMELYSGKEIYAEVSWLSKPVKTVTDLLPLLPKQRKS